MKKSTGLLSGCLLAIAVTAVVSIPESGMSQVPGAKSPTLSLARSAGSGSKLSPAEEKEVATTNHSTTASSPQPSSPQGGGVSGLTGRIKSFSRNGPTQESWNTIDLGTKYARAVTGGFEQGASFGLGVQLTTADALRFVEFRATVLTSLKLYRKFDGEAYFPRVFDENTHADVWFSYLRRTKDNFFGIGPRIPISKEQFLANHLASG